METKKIRIFVIDDHDSIRESYKRWFSSEGFLIVGDDKKLSSISKIKLAKPDIIFMDIDFSDNQMEGINYAKEINEKLKDVKIIFVSHYSDTHIVIEGIKAGALGYFCKSDKLQFLKQGIESVLNGYYYFSPTINAKIANFLTDSSVKCEGKKKNIAKFNLTEREERVLNYISQGLSNKEIAKEMATNEKNIKNAISSILSKMEARNRSHAIYLAVKSNII